ncbi:hypothetical protein GOP47_0006624 [Adiantum capillus-veneris]|uniref:Uncharacterized protein n=1 Tax=Adiantum capillus-veneris TaxID=13818 RepID=A0A9D4ZKG3_ADICA|nr:hypothetical protein GOP47_0006624 [Adiantum capillus-veneris]
MSISCYAELSKHPKIPLNKESYTHGVVGARDRGALIPFDGSDLPAEAAKLPKALTPCCPLLGFKAFDFLASPSQARNFESVAHCQAQA